MKFINRLAITLLATMPLSLSAIAQESEQSPVRLKILYNVSSLPTSLKVISTTDNLVLEDVIINKGKCVAGEKKSWTGNRLPKKLNYGESYQSRIDGLKGSSSRCHVILEVEAITNQGNWTWDF